MWMRGTYVGRILNFGASSKGTACQARKTVREKITKNLVFYGHRIFREVTSGRVRVRRLGGANLGYREPSISNLQVLSI